MIEKKVILDDEVWKELERRYGDKWQERVNFLLEKDLFGTDLIYWAKKKDKMAKQSSK